MIIEISKLGEEERVFRGEDPPEAMDLGETDEIRAAGPIRYDLKAAMVGGNLVVRGAVALDAEFLCVRCAEPFRKTVRDGEFLRVVESPKKDESVDLTPDIRESIILAFPTAPLCGPGCRGLCARCGTNLNTGSCGCRRGRDEGHWQALDNLKMG